MKTIKLLLISIILIGCADEKKEVEYPRYSIIIMEAVPDSLEDEYRAYIIKVASSVSFHMSAGQYEEPRRTLWAAQDIAEELYFTPMQGLKIQINKYPSHDINSPYHKLNSFYKSQFDLLKQQNP